MAEQLAMALEGLNALTLRVAELERFASSPLLLFFSSPSSPHDYLTLHRVWQTLITPRGKGRPMSIAFKQYVRGILATGCSAKAARGTVAMSAKTFLSPERWKQMELVLPLERWFRS
jgi:hypothetical protein